ncbi:hypothetical protein AX17_003498 [Amanita inopinata Kibby_2008]|nr:hypothetical protein AX17_003498 [Amanita inopinata Kibby_2008]
MPRIPLDYGTIISPGSIDHTLWTKKKYKLKSSQTLPQLFQDLNRVAFLGASLSKDTTTCVSTAVKQASETQHSHAAPTLKKSSFKSEYTPQEFTAVPNPIPETGIHQTLAQVPGYPLTAAFPMPTSLRHAATATESYPVFSASIPTQASTSTVLDILGAEPSSSMLASASDSLAPQKVDSPQQHALSNTVIALLGIGAGCLVLSTLIIIKVCTRVKRRPRPTPSLPILNDSYFADDLESKESPIFGGKERLSPKTDLDDAWVDLPRSGQAYVAPRPSRIAASEPEKLAGNYGTCTACPQEKGTYPGTSNTRTLCYPIANSQQDKTTTLQSHTSSFYHPPYQQLQNAISQTMKRLSTLSLSLYPATPRPVYEVGIAIGGQETPLTGDGYSVMARSRCKSNKPKDRQSRDSQGLAYDGVDESSPSIIGFENVVTVPHSSARGGRTRIKSSYYASGVYPHTSSAPQTSTTPGTERRNLLPNRSAQKPEPRREGDTRALTQALGLVTPTPDYEFSSPQSTLYPDDSLSTVDDEQSDHMKAMSWHTDEKAYHDITGCQTAPLASDEGTPLGTLMLMESSREVNKRGSRVAGEGQRRTGSYGDTLTVPCLSFNGGGKKVSQGVRTYDKPPRVPSPPLLPSLAQMAMEHANREGFENYRSATYSIYGLYGGERRSSGV